MQARIWNSPSHRRHARISLWSRVS
jgi:hypothetical protein